MSEEKIRNTEDKENTREEKPAQPVKPAPKKKHAKKKKKKGGRIAVSLAAVLLAIALLFGVVLGYAIGRKTMREQLDQAENRIDALADAYVESGRNDDIFESELNGENEEALLDLAGIVAEEEGNDLLGGDDLLGEEPDVAVEPVVVAEFDGGEIMSNEAAQVYEEQLAMYMFDGYTEDEIAGDLMGDVLQGLVADKLLYAKAQELGLDELSPEDEHETEHMADESFAQVVEMVESSMLDEGVSAEEAHDEALKYLAENEDITRETTLASIRENLWADKLYDEMVKDVTVSDEEIEAAYTDKLAEQKAAFEESPADYEFARMNDEAIVYNLPDCRRVRCLLIPLEDETLDAVIALNVEIASLDEKADAEKIAALKAERDAYYAASVEKAQAALEKLKGGAEFEAVLAETDPTADPENAELYIIANSALLPEEAVQAAMALENVGDISEPVCLDDGVAILIYAGDVTPGEVPLAEAKEAIRAELLPMAQFEAYNEMVNEMVAAANPKYYPERMQ